MRKRYVLLLILIVALVFGCDPSGSSGGCNGSSSGSSSSSSSTSSTSSSSSSTGGHAVEFSGADCVIPPLPSPGSVGNHGASLPDPFATLAGGRITSKDDWRCHRAEIKAQIEAYELGIKPYPVDNVTGNTTAGGINVTVQDKGRTMSFHADISTPNGSGPFPAVIGVGVNTLNKNIMNELGIASIMFDCNEMGQQNGVRGRGKFFDMYGTQFSDSSLMAWAWGVSRLIDALEKTPSAKIDTTKLAVTGCSRYGKGALVVGAFDERIALTIPQESGAGGTASWRVSQYLKNQGQNIQTASSAHSEQPWFDSVFGYFTNNVNNLPFDHHMLMAMIAPRGLLSIDNPIDWLGPESTQTDCVAAKETWKALGVDANMGVSQTSSAHTHCQFPSSQDAELRAFLKKFLKGSDNENTNIVKGPNVNRNQWIQWRTPVLQ